MSPNGDRHGRDRQPPQGTRPGGGIRTPSEEEKIADHHPPMPSDTRQTLTVADSGACINTCESRSLIFDRLANPSLKENLRHKFYQGHVARISRDALTAIRRRRLAVLNGLLNDGKTLRMELKARLVLNASGGVMENAGMCLDRFSNLPYIPGSAVKGCARRAALAFLREWTEAEAKPEGFDGAPAYDRPQDLFRDAALIFGWVDQDWKENQDFAWALGGSDKWREQRDDLARELLSVLRRPIAERPAPWKQLPSFEGVVGFHSAWPERSPSPDIELDVVTCHHRNYYDNKPGFETAPDTEDPVPVVFPAVAPNHVFIFAVFPLRRKLPPAIDANRLAATALAWLKLGLRVFGLGGKTAAGYGWFDCCQEVQQAVIPLLQAVELKGRKEREEAEAKRKVEEMKQAAEKAERDRLAKALPHERFYLEYRKLADEPFATQAKKHAEMTDDQRHGFVLALKERRDTAKRWAKKKPELLKPWQEIAQKLQPPIQLP